MCSAEDRNPIMGVAVWAHLARRSHRSADVRRHRALLAHIQNRRRLIWSRAEELRACCRNSLPAQSNSNSSRTTSKTSKPHRTASQRTCGMGTVLESRQYLTVLPLWPQEMLKIFGTQCKWSQMMHRNCRFVQDDQKSLIFKENWGDKDRCWCNKI